MESGIQSPESGIHDVESGIQDPLGFLYMGLYQGRFVFDQKFPKFSKRGPMVRKFPGKSSRKFGSCRISEKRTIQPKIPEIQVFKLSGRKISRKNVRKFGYTSRGCQAFLEIIQIRNFLFSASSFGYDHSELDISRKDDGDAHSKMD